jgi:hypothetical protein
MTDTQVQETEKNSGLLTDSEKESIKNISKMIEEHPSVTAVLLVMGGTALAVKLESVPDKESAAAALYTLGAGTVKAFDLNDVGSSEAAAAMGNTGLTAIYAASVLLNPEFQEEDN